MSQEKLETAAFGMGCFWGPFDLEVEPGLKDRMMNASRKML